MPRLPRSPGPSATGSSADALEDAPVREPLYKQVVEQLRRQIVAGVYSLGASLPTEAELGETFQVSRHTVREALRHLRADGLVSSKQGSGTVVTGSGSPQAFVHEVGAISDLIQYAAAMTFRIDRSETLVADGELAARLEAPAGSRWLHIEGRRHANADGELVCLTNVYVASEFAGVGRLVGRSGGAIYEMIESLYGVRIGEVDQTVHARPAPAGAAHLLGVAEDSTVIEVIRIYRLPTGRTAEVAVNLYPPERFSLTMKLRSKAP